ncbi:MAG TPA: phytanoyl-CoA dioxygenase family protein [Rhizomicrobium sp.]|nr:phytanoyl-CoA dioxygenase family protein [Rhizomicrobium sp.]
MKLSTDIVDRYEVDGFTFLPQVLDAKWLELIARGFERNMANPSPWGAEYQKKGGRFFTDNSNFAVNPEIQELLYDSPIVDLMAQLIRADQAWLYYDQVFYKDGEAVRTGWHQDMPYYLMKGDQVNGAWLCLEPLEKEYTLEVIRGSHKGPLYNGVNRLKPKEVGFDVGGPATPDIEAHREDYDIVSFDMKPGDMLVFHPKVLHGGAPTKAGRKRRTMTVNIFGPDILYEPRPEGHGPTFPGIENILKPGDPLHKATDYFYPLRPIPEKRPGVLKTHRFMHGRAS